LTVGPPGFQHHDAATLVGSESIDTVAENAQFADWFVNCLTTADPPDNPAEADFRAAVDSLLLWYVDHFTAAERVALAERLSDPPLLFAGEDRSATARGVVRALVP